MEILKTLMHFFYSYYTLRCAELDYGDYENSHALNIDAELVNR